MTVYILIVYFWAGGKLAYPMKFDTLGACQAEAEKQLEHPEAVAGTVCVESRSAVLARAKK